MIPVDTWVEHILNVPPEKLSRWTTLLREKRILVDKVIIENMVRYRDRKDEKAGYEPWSNIANRIISCAHRFIDGLPRFPIPASELTFVRNDPNRITGVRSGCAQRSPDVVVTLENVLQSLPSDGTRGIGWYNVISCVEFKQGGAQTAFDDWTKMVANVRASQPLPVKSRGQSQNTAVWSP